MLFTDGEFVTPDDDGLGGEGGDEAGGWDVDDDLELPPDLVGFLCKSIQTKVAHEPSLCDQCFDWVYFSNT